MYVPVDVTNLTSNGSVFENSTFPSEFLPLTLLLVEVRAANSSTSHKYIVLSKPADATTSTSLAYARHLT